MLPDFYNRAKEIINEVCPEINQRTENGSMLYLNGVNVGFGKINELVLKLESEGYIFASAAEEDGYIQLLQKTIECKPGMMYGEIPKKDLEKIKSHERPGGIKLPNIRRKK